MTIHIGRKKNRGQSKGRRKWFEISPSRKDGGVAVHWMRIIPSLHISHVLQIQSENSVSSVNLKSQFCIFTQNFHGISIMHPSPDLKHTLIEHQSFSKCIRNRYFLVQILYTIHDSNLIMNLDYLSDHIIWPS